MSGNVKLNLRSVSDVEGREEFTEGDEIVLEASFTKEVSRKKKEEYLASPPFFYKWEVMSGTRRVLELTGVDYVDFKDNKVCVSRVFDASQLPPGTYEAKVTIDGLSTKPTDNGTLVQAMRA